MILVIARREFKTLFLSPLAWTILAILQFILAFLFYSLVEAFIYKQPQLATMDSTLSLTDMTVAPLYGNAGIILLLVTPLLTMRMICEERRNKTLTLLLSAPLSNLDIIMGKYLGILGLLVVLIFMITLMPCSLLVGGTLDFGKLAANILALLLMAGAFGAIGLYMSCLASHPIVAAMGAFGGSFVLWILDWSASLSNQPSELIKYLSILRHFQNIQSGLITSADLSYFLLFISLFLMLSIRQLEKERLQK